MVNSKHEIRNPKQTKMFQIQMSQTKVLNLENLKFGFVSCIQLVSATLGIEDFRRSFESETFSRTVIEPGFDVC